MHYISYSTIPSVSANSVHVMKMCSALSNHNLDVYLYGLKGSSFDENDIFTNYQVSEKVNLKLMNKSKINILTRLKYLSYTKKNIKKSVIDLLYGRDIFTLFFLKSKVNNIIFEAHKLPSDILRITLWRIMIRYLSKRNFRVVVISEALKKDFIDMFKEIKHDMISVIHDCADDPTSEVVQEIRTLTPLDKKKTIGYIGSLNQGKGIDKIIEIAKLLPNINFYIVGGDQVSVDFWFNKCSDLANVYFHGFVQQKDLHFFYKNIDIFVAPYSKSVYGLGNKNEISKWMSPLKIFEYMSYKKVIICSDLPVLREILNDKNAILIEPDDYHKWANNISNLLKSNTLRNKLSHNAYLDFIEKYTWAKRAEKVLSLYED